VNLLIYTTATREPYAQLAREQLAALRACGYAGDYAVITDCHVEGAINYPATELEAKNRIANRRAKTRINTEGYTAVLFLESDVLINGGLLWALAELMRTPYIKVQGGDAAQIAAGMGGAPCPDVGMVPWAGMVYVPDSQYPFLKAWQREFDKPWTYEEEVLKAGLSGYSWEYSELCKFPCENPDAPFVHNAGFWNKPQCSEELEYLQPGKFPSHNPFKANPAFKHLYPELV
jgi:hypothetical protein